jgi:hypothetical protein
MDLLVLEVPKVQREPLEPLEPLEQLVQKAIEENKDAPETLSRLEQQDILVLLAPQVSRVQLDQRVLLAQLALLVPQV